MKNKNGLSVLKENYEWSGVYVNRILIWEDRKGKTENVTKK